MAHPRKRKHNFNPGDRFTMLTVLEDREAGARTVRCICDCGTEKSVFIGDLVGGKTLSCGCLRKQISSQVHRKHGSGYEDYRYRLWRNIKGKCLRETHHDYRFYGGRGILIYSAWINDFPAFAAWLTENLGERPENETLDRIDVDGNYEPGNLRWASRYEQVMNRRRQWARLSLADKAALVGDYAEGTITYRELGAKYNVSEQMAGIIVRSLNRF